MGSIPGPPLSTRTLYHKATEAVEREREREKRERERERSGWADKERKGVLINSVAVYS